MQILDFKEEKKYLMQILDFKEEKKILLTQ
jgi:hypothetical protein